jgi:NAD-dependent DNA ligase
MEKSKLIQEISDANAAYAVGIPFITDYDYDQLWQQLHSIEPENPVLYHTAHNHAVIHNKTWHKYPVFGTLKAFNMPDLMSFLTRFGDQELVFEPKYDGCAAVITQAKSGTILTLEGDGQLGGDITHLLPHIICDFPLRHFQTVELIIPWKDWDPSFGKNPRNVVAGWLARKYEKPPIKMTAVQHNFGHLIETYNYSGDLEKLGTILINLFAKWSKIYPMDGIMIKVADEKTRLIASHNGRANNWSIAWKPPIQTKKTKVTNVEWNISRLGRVIPTVIYEPIELCGTTNSRVTGNNAKWLIDKGIKINSTIIVGKAGEIIPKIVEVKNDFSDEADLIPSFCPNCSEPLTWEGVHLICTGPKCLAKLISSVDYFYSLKGVKIDGIGGAAIEKMVQDEKLYEVLLNNMWALLDMESYNISSEVFLTIGEGIYKQIINGVKIANKEKTMAHFIAGLGLPKLGYKSSVRLCQYIKSGSLNVPVSRGAMKSFIKGTLIFTDAKKELKNFHFADLPSAAKAVYCITGTLSQSRDDMINYFSELGYEFTHNVTRETNYLLIGENPGKIKAQRASRYNIPQINENQFIKIIKKENQNGN